MDKSWCKVLARFAKDDRYKDQISNQFSFTQ